MELEKLKTDKTVYTTLAEMFLGWSEKTLKESNVPIAFKNIQTVFSFLAVVDKRIIKEVFKLRKIEEASKEPGKKIIKARILWEIFRAKRLIKKLKNGKRKSIFKIELITSSEELWKYYDEITTDPEIKGNNEFVLKRLFELLFVILLRDFDNAQEFVGKCQNVIISDGVTVLRERLAGYDASNEHILLYSFYKIELKKVGGETMIMPNMNIYGLLLYYTLGMLKNKEGTIENKYMSFIIDKFIENIKPEDITLTTANLNHIRNDIIIGYYDKELVFYSPECTYKNKIRYDEKNVELSGDEQKKIFVKKALDKLASYPTNKDSDVSERVNRFLDKGAIIELNMKTALLFADSRFKIIQVVHTGRTRDVIYISKKYLEILMKNNNVNELAVWLNHALRISDAIKMNKDNIEKAQKMMTEINSEIFSNVKTHLKLIDPQSLQIRMKTFMQEYLKITLVETISELGNLENEARKNNEIDQNIRKYPNFNIENIEDAAFRLMHLYGTLGMISKTQQSFKLYKETVEKIQSYDNQGVCPLILQSNKIMTALRYGFFDEFLPELEVFLIRGFKTCSQNNITTEMVTITSFLYKPFEEGNFRENIDIYLKAHLRAAGENIDRKNKVLGIIAQSDVLMDEFEERYVKN